MTQQQPKWVQAQLQSQQALIAAQYACIEEQNATIRMLQNQRFEAFTGQATEHKQLENSLQGGAAEVAFTARISFS